MKTKDKQLKCSKTLNCASQSIDEAEDILITTNSVENSSKDKKYMIVQSTNHQYLSSPEYVNIPSTSSSIVKDYKPNKQKYSTQQTISQFKHKPSLKNYIRKASPEDDEIGDSSEGDSSSYLSAISYQSRLELGAETIFNYRYDDIDDYTITNNRKFYKNPNPNLNPL